MRTDHLSRAATAAAYQSVTLTELRTAFDELDFDLREVLRRDEAVGSGIDEAQDEADRIRARLRELGVPVPEVAGSTTADAAAPPSERPLPARTVPIVPAELDFDELVGLAQARLDLLGVDLTQDPLLQVLPAAQVSRELQHYRDSHGDISWSEADWAVVLSAGMLATLVDIAMVRIPQDVTFLGKHQAGSQWTAFLTESDWAGELRQRLKSFEGAKVPYDANHTAATKGAVSGMRPATHRLQSLGHDPLLGFVIGVADIMSGRGSYVDSTGTFIQLLDQAEPVELIEALITQVRHLLSDVATPAGLPAPLLGLLQFVQAESPFALGSSGKRVPWTDVARYLYVEGYDLRHFAVMGLVPAVIEVVIRGYWHLSGWVQGRSSEQQAREKAKLASMLLLGHGIATSGTLLKTGLLFQMNPLALNLPQLMATAPAVVAWLHESARRDRRIQVALKTEWESLLAPSGKH